MTGAVGSRMRRVVTGLLVVLLVAGCGVDDGARIRDRDGAGVQPSEADD